jgi:flavin-dependent dehydrogenase
VPTERFEIAVLGAGPAGTATALGLAGLGYSVVVVAPPAARARPQRESLSLRVVAALRSLGLEAALATLEPPGARLVRWAGDERALPGEAAVERSAFDAGLLADLTRLGVRVLRDEVTSLGGGADGARIALASGGALWVRLAVEARGRTAPSGGARERGPATVCIVQRWRGDATGCARTAVASLDSGWAWLADDGRGGFTTQLALDARAAAPRGELAAHSEEALRGDRWLREQLSGAAPEGAPFARTATPVLDGALATGAVLRVGDAALAVDPLSGNGIFQALSTALVAPAVVNTLLRRPERADLARAFAVARARDLFLRFARVSQDFYARGAARHGGPFWQARAVWPPAERGPSPAPTGPPAIARRPVVCDGWIEEREVVVTAARPLGTWRVAGVELAPLVRAAQRDPAAEAQALAALSERERAPVRAWLRAHGLGRAPSPGRGDG